MFGNALTKESEEVYVARAEPFYCSAAMIDRIEQESLTAPRGRVRICCHRDRSHALHEMLIALAPQSYIRPHRHHGKSESLHVIRGSAYYLLFSDRGQLERIDLISSQNNFFVRIETAKFHTLVIEKGPFVFHETTMGPFVREQTEYADWAPPEESSVAADYLSLLRKEVQGWKTV